MSRQNKTIWIAALLILGLVAPPLFAEPAGSPRKSVEALLHAIQQIRTGDPLTAEQKQANKEHSDRALGYLNVAEVSRKSLGKYWKKRSPKEQEDFSKLLGGLFVHVAFPNSGKFFSDLKIVYGQTINKDKKAVVPVTVVHQKEGEVSIDFHMVRNDKKWTVVDVLLDEVSMRNNLRSQFYKVLAKNQFEELVRRMAKKLTASVTPTRRGGNGS